MIYEKGLIKAMKQEYGKAKWLPWLRSPVEE